MLVFGYVLSRREIRDSDDYIVAGRRLPRMVLVGTLLATWVGSGTIVGGASFAYQYGPWAALFFFGGAPVGILTLYFFLAERARGFATYTVPEVLEIRYGALARTLGAIFILLAYVGIVSYQFTGGGYVLNVTTGLPVWAGTLLMAVIIVVLAALGGLVSVAYTDAASALIIVVGLALGVVFALSEVGGVGALLSDLPEPKTTWNGGLTPLQLLGFFLPVTLLLLGDQNLYQRFSAARDPESAKRSALGFFLGDILTFWMVVVLAVCAAVLLPDLASPDNAILSLAAQEMPVLVGAMILTAAVGLIVTTGNSFLLSTASNIVYDLYIRLFRQELPDRKRLFFTRLTVIVLGILAYLMGQFFPSVLTIQVYSYTMYGAAITPALIAAYVWRRATPAGGIASIVSGGGATLLWELVLGRPFDLNGVLFALPVSLVALVGVSLVTRPLAAGDQET